MDLTERINTLIDRVKKPEHLVHLVHAYVDAGIINGIDDKSMHKKVSSLKESDQIILNDDQRDIIDLAIERTFDTDDEGKFFCYSRDNEGKGILYNLNRRLNIIEYSMANPDSLGLGDESRVVGKRLGGGFDSNVFETISFTSGIVPIKVFKEPGYLVAEAISKEGITLVERIMNTYNVDDKLRSVNQRNIMKISGRGSCEGVVSKDYTKLDGNHTFYIELEDIDGNAIEQNYKIIPVKNVSDTYGQILNGMYNTHKAGFMVRDLKLSNILISDDQKNVKIGDLETFAKLEDVQTKVRLTQGSTRYAAPESRKSSDLHTMQSDIYSCSVCYLYFLKNETDLISKINTLEEEEYNAKLNGILSNLATNQQKFLKKGLAFKPENRYKTSKEMVDAWNFYTL